MASSTLHYRHGSFDMDKYELQKYEPMKNRSESARIRASQSPDATIAGVIAHDLMQWVLESGISNQESSIKQLKKCLHQLTQSDFTHQLTHDFIKDLMPSSVHDARLQLIIEKTTGLIRSWERFLDKFTVESIHSERALWKELDSFEGERTFLLARADAIICTPDGQIVLEFKTGNLSKTSEWINQLELYATLLDGDVYKLAILHPNKSGHISPKGIQINGFLDRTDEEKPGNHCKKCPYSSNSRCDTYEQWELSIRTPILV